MDRTNVFFLIAAGAAAWWVYNEYQKQRADQAAMFIRQDALNVSPKSYADQMATGYI
jgi:cbb3-type cytochrome oxidase subunit 3